MSIVDLTQERERRSPHAEGPARCQACKHEWMATVAVPLPPQLECPACGAQRGFFQWPAVPPVGVLWLACVACGEHLFSIMPGFEIMCACCGTRQALPES